MANQFYNTGINAFATGQLDWTSGTDTYWAILIDTASYTFDAAHQYLSSIAGGARVADVAITNRTAVAGVLDADDVTFSAVSGPSCEAIVVCKYTGVDSTSPLILYLDTGITGLPLTPNGLDVVLAWDNGAYKIAQI